MKFNLRTGRDTPSPCGTTMRWSGKRRCNGTSGTIGRNREHSLQSNDELCPRIIEGLEIRSVDNWEVKSAWAWESCIELSDTLMILNTVKLY